MALPPALPVRHGHALSIVVVAIVFPTLATVAVIGRFCARRLKRVNISADDWLIVSAVIAVYAHMILIIFFAMYGGAGHHIDELSPSNLAVFFKLLAAVQFSFGISLGLVKISICLLLARIFVVRPFQIAASCVATYCTCWTIMVVSIGAGLCRPFAYNWDKSIHGGKCGNLDAAYISVAALDIIGDVMIIALPMRWVWKLNASRASKIGLSIVFALGFLDIIVAILRIVYLVNTNVSTDPDFTFDLTNTFVWSVIEPSLGVIVACGALLRPIFRKCLPNIFLCSGESLTTYSLNGQKNPRQYSNISNDEFLLQRLGATNSRDQAGPNFHPTTASEVRGRADSPKAAEERLENDVGKIIVQNEFTVERDLANSS